MYTMLQSSSSDEVIICTEEKYAAMKAKYFCEGSGRDLKDYVVAHSKEPAILVTISLGSNTFLMKGE